MLSRMVVIAMMLSFAPAASAAEEACCTCRANQGGFPFKVRIPAGFGAGPCRTACASSGGAYVSYSPMACDAAPPKNMPKDGDSFEKVVGGNCKGNHWCQFGFTIGPSKTTLKPGEELTVIFTGGNLGSVDNKYHT